MHHNKRFNKVKLISIHYMQKRFFTLLFIVLISSVLSQQSTAQEVVQSYEALMQSGNEKLNSGDFISAKTYFEMALQKEKDDAEAQQKLDETVENIKLQMQKQEGFYLKLDQGDRLRDANKLEEAKKAYEEALQVFPDDKYTLEQLKNINKTLEEEKNKLENYENALALGTSLLEQKKYEEAMLQFQLAIDLYPEQALPREKLNETTQLLEKRKVAETKSAELRAAAEELIRRKEFENALLKLKEAQALTPTDITLAQLIEETELLSQKAATYSEILAQADQQYANKNFEKAREHYNAALKVWPGQSYAEDMIQRINQTLESENYLAQQQYNEAIAAAANYEAEGELELALSSYEEALLLKENDELALEKIEAIEATIQAREQATQIASQVNDLLEQASQAEEDKAFENAINIYEQILTISPDEAGITEKITSLQQILAEAQEIESTYQLVMQTAATLLEQESLREARAKYVEAFNIMPSRTEPQEKIYQIDQQLAANALQEAAIENEYTRLISLASQSYDNQELDLALDYYQQAAALKPDQDQLSAKIGEINALMNEQQQLQQRENNYSQLIETADQYFEAGNFADAKTNYQEADRLFGDRTYPKEKITAIAQIQEELAATEALEAEFNNTLQNADAAFTAEKLEEAKQLYEAALAIKLSTYAEEQIAKINVTLAEIAEAEALNQAYVQKIEIADSLYVLENWEQAQLSYQEALDLNPSATYPKDQVTMIEEKLNAIAASKALEAQISKLINQADQAFEDQKLEKAQQLYAEILTLDPANAAALSRSAEINIQLKAAAAERQQRFEEAMASGEQFLADKSYQDALKQYKIAMGIFPEDETVKAKIEQLDNIIREEKLKLMTAYTKIIKEADQHYNAKTFDKAIDQYNKAALLKTGETYPAEMIAQITQTIQDNKLVELNLNPVVVPSGATKRFEFEPVSITERRTNYILIKARNTGQKGFPLIISFGSKNGRNGGFVLPIPDDQEYHDFVVRIGSQYKWFSEDNTWIEILPENGEVELGITQISRGF
ncbi:MAG: hypothetical protein KKC86_08630 [Bacteroidetes bacterium]|nr:hypothetical protein [Bacteroidota bacterium]